MNNVFNIGQKNANSLLPLGVPGANAINRLRVNVENLNQKVNTTLNNLYKNVSTNANAVVNNVANAVPNVLPNVMGNTVANASQGSTWGTVMVIFGILLVVFVVAMMVFGQEITLAWNAFFAQMRDVLGMKMPPPDMPKDAGLDVLKPSIPPEDEKVPSSQLAEKILPSGGAGPEVYNVSKNTFTYYDAEPLCKALGAELATYEQVKQAWERGADWCNYGWVKGQNAIYPTQNSTWEKLQTGPEEQRMACGKPGLNGGFFDNPELRFGVNCYGPKPQQSKHDEAAVAKRTGVPLTPSGIEFDKKVSKYRGESDSIGVLPFNEGKWSTN